MVGSTCPGNADPEPVSAPAAALPAARGHLTDGVYYMAGCPEAR